MTLPLTKIPEQKYLGNQKREFTANTEQLMARINEDPSNDTSFRTDDEFRSQKGETGGSRKVDSTTREIRKWESKNLVDNERKL